MQVNLRYFAAFRDAMGRDGESCELETAMPLASALAALRDRDVTLAEALAATPRARFAVNQRFANKDTMLAEGDEVAIFPPVTGG